MIVKKEEEKKKEDEESKTNMTRMKGRRERMKQRE